uniref:Fam-e protein n=1 Tax=Strongyloides venezuelensis TaxID=75913 RepID=A0A0K0FAY0_STRVS
MIEKCSQKQMICYICIILGVSLCIFILEEYVEEQSYEKNLHIINSPNYNHYVDPNNNDSKRDLDKKQIIISKKDLTEDKLSLLCKNKKNLKSLQMCSSCEERDKDNNTYLKDICLKEGYYTKFECVNESKLIIQSCKILTKDEKKSFYIFLICSLTSSALFSYLSIDRLHKNENNSYTKINNLAT